MRVITSVAALAPLRNAEQVRELIEAGFRCNVGCREDVGGLEGGIGGREELESSPALRVPERAGG